MSAETITQIIILGSPLVWIGWDIYVFIKDGNAWTESSNVWKWAVRLPGIALLVGILCGHFFFQMHLPTELPTDDQGNYIFQTAVDVKAGTYLVPNADGELVPK